MSLTEKIRESLPVDSDGMNLKTIPNINMVCLKNKVLLLMGGSAYSKGIYEYQKEKQFRIITVGKDPNTPISLIADKFYNVDTQDVDTIVDIVIKEKVDGIFVGSSEVNISPAIDVAERTGVNFYVNRKQWDIISNKARFKNLARVYGLPVIPEFELSQDPTTEEIENLEYPVMIKPTDSSGARGMNPCYSVEDFKKLYDEALKHSKRKEIIVEKLIVDAKEVFVNYTVQDGIPTLSYAFTKFKAETSNDKILVPLFHMYPCNNIDEYYEKVDLSAKKMIAGLGLKNGTLTLQGFYKNCEFFFFEAGFRMGGAQAYILTEYNWGANVLKYMINYALTGTMSEQNLSQIENAKFKFPCCNYYIALKAGTIDTIENLELIYKLPGVINVTQMCNEGDIIADTNALERIAFRIHVVGKDNVDLANNLVNISSTIKITSTSGEEMQIEPLSFERCIQVITDK